MGLMIEFGAVEQVGEGQGLTAREMLKNHIKKNK